MRLCRGRGVGCSRAAVVDNAFTAVDEQLLNVYTINYEKGIVLNNNDGMWLYR